jgi:hypothetical protein
MKRSLLVFTLTFYFFSFYAQTWQWAQRFAGDGDGMSICVAPNGNLLASGVFSSQIVIGTNTLNGAGYSGYLTYFDPSGNIFWVKSITSGNALNAPYSITCDQSMNVYVAGAFTGSTATFDSFTVTNGGGAITAYVAKYNSSGVAQWVQTSFSNGGLDEIVSSVTDNQGNTFVTGSYSGTMALGSITLANTPINAAFIAKYDASGNVIWAKNSVSSVTDKATSISRDNNGNLYITGFFSSPTIVFGTYTLTNSGAQNIFVVKYDAGGNVVWAKKAGGTSGDYASALSTDAQGNSYVTGNINSGNAVFGSNTLTLAGSGSNLFLASYNSNGNINWVKNYGSGLQGQSIACYSAGVIVSGLTGSVSPCVIGNFSVVPTASFDPAFVAHWDWTGVPTFAQGLSSGGDDWFPVAIDNLCNAYFSGDYVTNPFVIGSFSLALAGTDETPFIAKMNFNCSILPDGVNENSSDKNNLSLFPNPNNGSFSVKTNFIEEGEIKMFNSVGEIIHEQKISGKTHTIELKGISKGLYYFSISENGKTFGRGKIVIE